MRYRYRLLSSGTTMALLALAGPGATPAGAFPFASHTGTASAMANAPQGASDSATGSPSDPSAPAFQASAFAHQPGSGQASAIASGQIDTSRPEALSITTQVSADASLSSAFSGMSEAEGQVVDQIVHFLMPGSNLDLSYSLSFTTAGQSQNTQIIASIHVENLTTAQSILSIAAPTVDMLRFGGSAGDQVRVTISLDAVAQAPGGMAGLSAFAEAVAELTFMPLPGDANLDGMVNISDLSVLAANWQQTGRRWNHGDFNSDGIVNIGDLSILAANWQAGVGGEAMGLRFDQAMGMFDPFDRLRAGTSDKLGASALDGVVVPEPASLVLVGLSGLLALRRRQYDRPPRG